jgi:hypothetical protein
MPEIFGIRSPLIDPSKKSPETVGVEAHAGKFTKDQVTL